MICALKTGKLKKKLEFIKNIDIDRLSIVLKMFPESIDEDIKTELNFFDRLLVDLSSRNLSLLQVVIYIYKKIFSIAQFFKRR